MNVIEVHNQADWYTANMLKQSIALMKKKNIEGKYDVAIDKEESILRSFFESLQEQAEARSQAA